MKKKSFIFNMTQPTKPVDMKHKIIFTHPKTNIPTVGNLKSIDGSYYIIEFNGVIYELLENEVDFIKPLGRPKGVKNK